MVPKVSVVMSAYNCEQEIELAVASIVAQTFQDWELIAIDDGSTDGTHERLAGFQDQRIRVVRERERKGLAYRLNQGIAIARGAYVGRMDADDISYPERLSKQVAYLDKSPDTDLLGTAAFAFEPGFRAIGVCDVEPSHEGVCANPASGFRMPHPSWMGKRNWFEKHPYRTDAKRAQDQDLLVRTFRSSRFANLEEILIGYRQSLPKINHILMGRWSYGRACWRYNQNLGGRFPALLGVSEQVVRSMVTVPLIVFGQADWVLRRRFRTATSAEKEQFNQVCGSLSAIDCFRSVRQENGSELQAQSDSPNLGPL